MGSSLTAGQWPVSIEMRPATKFKHEFKAFLAGIGFQLKHFLPDDNVGEKMFTNCLIPRATGYEKLRGEGGLSEALALQWARRSEHFLQEALKKGHAVQLDGISFIDYEGSEPKVNWRKLIALYEAETLVPLRIKTDDSIDDVKAEKILAAVRAVAGEIRIVVAKVNEGCTEVTILVSREAADEVLSLVASLGRPAEVVSVEEIAMPAKNWLARAWWLAGSTIDLAKPDALDRFTQAWRRAIRIEWAIRPWRRLRWLASPAIRSSPMARVISDSNERAYAADLVGEGAALAADIQMACGTWPLFAALSLSVVLVAVHAFFPSAAIAAGVATGLALSLAGAQVCSAALSPVACGAGTIVMCWAFGLVQAVAIGLMGNGGSLSRVNIHRDFFVSVTGGIVGLCAPEWHARMPLPLAILLLCVIATAIAAAGWFMMQPAKAGAVVRTSGRRWMLGTLAGAAMGAGIGLVRAISIVLTHWGCPQQLAFIAAFVLAGSAVFAFTIRLRIPKLRRGKMLVFALSYAAVAATLCGLAYQRAGGGLGLVALAACTGWYHATWFTAASVVGQRIGDARAAVLATTLEGAVGFSAFVVFQFMQG